MFDAANDERVRAASHRAGTIAFYCMWATTFLLMVTSVMTDADPLGDPSFTLIIPWLVGTFTYVIMLWTGGVYSTFRDEATRTPAKLKEARLRLFLSTVLFAGVLFLFKRLNIFDHENATLQQDALETLGLTLTWALGMWFMMARKRRSTSKEVED
jgi:hypothetical protein